MHSILYKCTPINYYSTESVSMHQSTTVPLSLQLQGRAIPCIANAICQAHSPNQRFENPRKTDGIPASSPLSLSRSFSLGKCNLSKLERTTSNHPFNWKWIVERKSGFSSSAPRRPLSLSPVLTRRVILPSPTQSYCLLIRHHRDSRAVAFFSSGSLIFPLGEYLFGWN